MSDSVASSLRKEIVSGLKNVNKLQRLVALVTVDASAPADSEAVRLADVVSNLRAVFAHFDSQGILAQGEAAAAGDSAPAAKRARGAGVTAAAPAGGATAKVGAWVLARWDDALAALLRAAADAALAPGLRDAAVDGWVALVARASAAQAATHVARAVDALAAAAAPAKSAGDAPAAARQQHKWEKVATRRVLERLAATHLAAHADLYAAWLQALLRRLGTPRGLAGPLTLLALTPLPTEAAGAGAAALWRDAGVRRGGGDDGATLYGACWTAVLRHELPDALLRKVLRVLPEAVLPFVPHPLTLLDMLTAAYARGGILSVLSLKGIYYMMTHNSLDFPDFYKQLYALVDPVVLGSKYRDEFITLLDQFLQSAFIPASTVASFVKKMARLSLTAAPATLLVLMPFCYNVLEFHKPVRGLVAWARKDRAAAQPWTDPFDETERDPAKTHALDSCVWELRMHRTHLVPAVANIATMFQNQDFKEPPYGIDDFAGTSYQSLFEAELTRKVKKGVALEYRTNSSVFAHLECAWDVPLPTAADETSGDRLA